MKLTINFTLYPLHVALLYLVALAGAEVTTALTDPYIGLTVHALILTVLVFHTTAVWHDPGHRFLMTLIVAPLIRIISLSLPLVTFSLSYWFLIVSVPLFITIFLIVRTLGLSWQGLGLNTRKLPLQLLIIPTGILFGYIEYLILRPEPLIESLTWQQFVIPALILLISTGFFEELSFRGMMQSTAMETFGRFGILYIALLFAILHIGHKSLLDVLFIFGVGLFFGWIAIKTGSIIGVTLSHGLLNICLFLVMPFLFAIAPDADNTAISNSFPPMALATTLPSGVQPSGAETPGTPSTTTPMPSETAVAIAPITPSPNPAQGTATTIAVPIQPGELGPEATATAVPQTDAFAPILTPTAGAQLPTNRPDASQAAVQNSASIPIGVQLPTTTQPSVVQEQQGGTLRNIPYLRYENGVFIYSIAAHLPSTPEHLSQQAAGPLETATLFAPILPQDGYTPIQRLVSFRWQTDLVLEANQQFAVVFWQADQRPFDSQFGIFAPAGLSEVAIDFVQLRTLLKEQFEPGDYQWGVLLIQKESTYVQQAYLGGGHRIQLD